MSAPPSLPAVLAPLTALDLKGTAVTLGTLWQLEPVLLVWVRHYG